ncbi:hypothetical protein BD779DRAFT_1680768 [Infundibulicybe gibba]|nr:hypothetical protein BD779DRAFT_1680768 [Infundibulicybe gibba]
MASAKAGRRTSHLGDPGAPRHSRQWIGNHGNGLRYKGNTLSNDTNQNGRSEVEMSKNVLEADEELGARRTALLAKKHTQLDEHYARHDTFVRELFHMEHFKMMVGYNPEEAKRDDTNVFQEYKSKFDLLDAAPSAGPSRKTRSARSERQQILKHPPISAPIVHPNKRQKTKPQNTEAIWDILAIAKDKGKGKLVVVEEPDDDALYGHHSNSISMAPPRSRGEPKPFVGDKPPAKVTRRSSRAHVVSPTIQVRSPLSHAVVSCPPFPHSQLPSSFNIKRVKLIVRRPPPLLSNPRQKPPPAKHNSSLKHFLDSYYTFNGEDVSENFLQKQAAEHATILERVDMFRSQGRFIPGTDILFGSSMDQKPPFTTPQRPQRNKKASGRQVAAQIAGKIQTYWDSQASKKDKAKVQEERKLRILAKTTIKMVIAEWRKAVFHIREQERLRLEAEEVKRGRAHLDAILDQSGQILETQQNDLNFSRSRSHSSLAFDSPRGWNYADEDDEDGEEGHDSEHDSEEDNMDVEDDEESGVDEDMPEEDTAQLLLGDRLVAPAPSSIASPLPEPPPSTPPLPPQTPQTSGDDGSAVGETAFEDRDTEPPLLHTSHSKDDVPESAQTSKDSLCKIRHQTCTDDARPCTSPLSLVPNGPDYSSPVPSSPQDNLVTTHQETLEDGINGSEEIPRVDHEEQDEPSEFAIPHYLRPYAVAPVSWESGTKVKPPLLLRGVLRPYQQSGLEWLATLHMNNLNGILADEMGLGKTIQTISLLAHLACDRGIWGPISYVLLNWEMEFKKFLPGFKILSYHGTTKRRKELRQGWTDKHHFNVCITSYTLASRDAHIFKRKAWYYMILDEAHMIKNFKSQRWNILLMFRSFRRLLLTGTPLQNNLTELWALLQFLMRLKRDVEKELPSKYEHLVLCPLSKRQRFLYDEFMSRAQTRDALSSGIYQKIANILMQLRKVCNHPDLFEVRPIVTSFAMERSAIADFEIKELLIRRRLNTPLLPALELQRLDATARLSLDSEVLGEPPPADTLTINGYLRTHAGRRKPAETISIANNLHRPLLPLAALDLRHNYLDIALPVNLSIKSYATRAEEMATIVNVFAFVTPAVVALDLPRLALKGCETLIESQAQGLDTVLHQAASSCKLLSQIHPFYNTTAGPHLHTMTRILDILEIFLNFHGYLYLRLDGATKIEDRQYITERFNADPRVFCFIASSRSGGVGINLTGADTVVFYDSDFNPQMDRQCEDRAHRIGQIRDVHIYRFVSQYTVEEALLRKANQKRSLDDLVIQKGEFDWRSLFNDESALTKALGEFEDTEDAHAAAVAANEETFLEGADQADFDDIEGDHTTYQTPNITTNGSGVPEEDGADADENDEEEGTIVDYMLATVERDYDFFRDWRI